MQTQLSFAQAEMTAKKKVTRKEKFLAEMEQIVPWARLVALLEPVYPKGKRGRPPIGIERMLRIYFIQLWYTLADEAVEDALYDMQALRTFCGIDLSSERVPDATTLLGFRHLLERHQLGPKILEEVNLHLGERHLFMREGTIVDATIIAAPSSTKNAKKERDPQMHQTKKGNAWHFGMKAHIGVDADSGLVHSMRATAAHVADIACAAEMLHGAEKAALADAGYLGVERRPEVLAKESQVQWHVAAKRSKLKAMGEGALKELTQQLEKMKASLRAKVEHPFHVVKNVFRFRKVRYRGLAKNENMLFALFALANIVLAKRTLLAEAR